MAKKMPKPSNVPDPLSLNALIIHPFWHIESL